MNRQENIRMNIGTLISGVITGAAIGFLAASVSQWIFILLLAPIVVTGFAGYNFYKLGHIWGQIDELDRHEDSWKKVYEVIDQFEAQKDDHK